VAGLSGITAIAAGGYHALALKNDGTVWAWGHNDLGELGDGTTLDRSTPVQVSGLTGARSISAGMSHSVASTSDGTVWSWGDNFRGQLGDGANPTTFTPHSAPVQATNVSGVASVNAGDFYTIVLSLRQATTTYSYDKLYRLIGASGPAATTGYTYDPVGNRSSKLLGGTTNYTYDRADRIITAGSSTYSVNPNGNVTQRGLDALAYDQANRLTCYQATAGSCSPATATATYRYDGDGKRTSKTVGTTTTNYTYDIGLGLPVILSDATRKYVWGAGGLAYTTDLSGSLQGVYHTDGLGSVRAITDGSGDVVQTYQADEFGIPALSQGTSTQPFGFTGEPQDPEDGLSCLRARMYDPSTGRFSQRDIAAGATQNPQSLNRYVYVQNNPIRFRDPSGHAISKLLENDCFTTASGIVHGYIVNARCLDFPLTTIAFVTVRVPGSLFTVIQEVLLSGEPPNDGGGGDEGGQDDIPATIHGAERLRQAGFRYADYLAIKAGEALKQADGANVYFKKVGRNAYNVIVEDANGVVTAMKNKTRYELQRLAQNYGWYYPGQVP
jgi:RHS repeat-associated protein